ncbi:hypothetical protein CK203_099081 [Vitis vinifera]|uniref:Retrotransposon gag domain-containing protein n=1 Tax=Vitis vinifera TaxID=29760 RepID=A0A438BTR8_VITVI|nr:hypothetical protein CK203_099081 [Vitis vinifera]
MASSHRKKTVGKRTTTESSPPRDRKIKRRKRGITHPGFNIKAPRRVIPEACNVRPHKPHTPYLELSVRKAQTLLIFQQKDNAIEIPVVKFNARKTRPQEPGRPRPPAATTWAARPDPVVTPMAGRNLPNEPPVGSISKRLDDMLSTPFCSHIIHYKPPRGFLVPKFSTYDGSSDPFDHIMHYRQLMTLDIGNDALLCKVFPTSLQGQALSWFHRLPPNSVDNFRDLSEAFVGQYLCSARHKQNISTLQNIKMQDNESLREFVRRFGQAVLQVEACSMDAVLQIFKRSICPGTPFFESLAKKPPTTMDDLFRRANKYSMLEDDVRAATQQVLVAGQASRGGTERNAKPLDQPRPSDRRQEGPSRPDRPPLTPLSISYEKLLPMIQSLSDFRWPRPQGTDPSKRDHSKRCAFHKEHGHTIETCRCLHYLVEKLIKAGHLKQYLCSDTRGKDASQNHNSGAPRAPAAPRWDNHFPTSRPTRTLQPHRDTLILSLEVVDFDVRRILVDPGSSADLVQASVVSHMGHSLAGLENPKRILSGFNGSSTTSLGDIVLPVQAGPVTLNVQFSVVQDLSPFNVILGRTWLHYMKVIPSTYHQMVSFLTNDGQIDLYGSQLAARQCYQIAREAGTSQEDASLPEPNNARHTVEVYIDDIVVKSKTRDEHVLHLQEVFYLLRKYGMKLNPSKCAFGVSAGKFLGFMVSQRGIEVSPDQVKAVIENTTTQDQEGVTTTHRQACRTRAFYSPLH